MRKARLQETRDEIVGLLAEHLVDSTRLVLLHLMDSMDVDTLTDFHQRVINALEQHHRALTLMTEPDYLGGILDDLQTRPVDLTTWVDPSELTCCHQINLEDDPVIERHNDRIQNRRLDRFTRRREKEMQLEAAEKDRRAEELVQRLASPRVVVNPALAVYADNSH